MRSLCIQSWDGQLLCFLAMRSPGNDVTGTTTEKRGNRGRKEDLPLTKEEEAGRIRLLGVCTAVIGRSCPMHQSWWGHRTGRLTVAG